ncbi:hypothetical protein [Polycladospora coralii]
MLNELDHLNMIDLLCDENLQSFHEQIGLKTAHGMFIRNYHHHSGVTV